MFERTQTSLGIVAMSEAQKLTELDSWQIRVAQIAKLSAQCQRLWDFSCPCITDKGMVFTPEVSARGSGRIACP